ADLNDEWKADPGEVLLIGAANAVAFVPAGQQRYYRLRATGSASEAPALSFGALLSWPVDQNQTLEFSPSQDGVWQKFPGDQGIVGDTHYAIIPDNLQAHYFRTRRANP